MQKRKEDTTSLLMKNDDICARCRGRICEICECFPNPWQPHLSTTPAGIPSISELPSEDTSSTSEATESPESSGARTTPSDDSNRLLEECFYRHPSTDEDTDEDQLGTRWRQLLQGPPPGLTTPEESMGQDGHVYFRRRQNAAWRHWWAMHQNSIDYNPKMPIFPPTPTSTCPPSPSMSFRPPLLMEQDIDSSVVYMPVPVECVPKVHQFLENLKRERFVNM